jgi:hypothetical protein
MVISSQAVISNIMLDIHIIIKHDLPSENTENKVHKTVIVGKINTSQFRKSIMTDRILCYMLYREFIAK